MKKIVVLLLLLPIMSMAQQSIEGVITEATETNEDVPLVGANVFWLNTTVGTFTDIDGKFSI